MPARRHLFACVLALAFGLAAPAAFGADAAALPKKEISEKTSASLGQLRTLTDAKDYPGSLKLIDTLLASAAPTSFDTYVLTQVKIQILLTQGRLNEAIAPLEAALKLGEDNTNFFDAPTNLEQLNLLAQLHYQRASEAGEPAVQKAGYQTALGYITRWFERSPRPTADVRLFASSLLYQLATVDAAKPDAARIREAITQAREGLLLAVKPSSQLYLILVACHLQLGESARAGEYLEILAARDPRNATTWSQLQSVYLATAAETKDPEEARRLNLRALLVLDRAQAVGQLDTAKDHYTRVAILFNIRQFTRAAALLEKGLSDGAIEGSKRNWELLASAYQQTSEEEKALDALTRAVAKFPADAALEFSLAQALYNAGNTADAYARGQAAVAKGTLEKPGQARVYLAYLAFELQRYDEASRWVADARAAGGVPASTLDPLANAIGVAVSARQKVERL